MNRLISIILIIIVGLVSWAEDLRVTKMEATTDAMIVPMQRKDLNGEICALVKVLLPVEDCKFEGNVIESYYDVGEYWVYLTPGTKQFKIKCPGKTPIMVTFGDYGIPQLESKRIYNLGISGYESPVAQAYDESVNLILHISPAADASVAIDGQSAQPVPANGTWTGSLSNGSHSYVITANGYTEVNGSVTVKEGERLEKNIQLLIPLEITCATPNAEIFINDESKGIDFWKGNLQPGNYKIEARLKNYRNSTITYNLIANQSNHIIIPELSAILGSLNVDFEPAGTKVKVDKKDYGIVPITIDGLIVGEHTVTLSYENFYPQEIQVTINENEPTVLTGELIQRPETEGELNGHVWVDLGLPSGTKWATCNVGAEKPEEFGRYFQWGNVSEPADGKYDFTNCVLENMGNPKKNKKLKKIGMDKNKDISGLIGYDAATSNWGEGWCMPTKDQFEEIIKSCEIKYITENEIPGVKIIGPNGNSIFLPKAGYMDFDSEVPHFSFTYWSSTPWSRSSYCLEGYKEKLWMNFPFRNRGMPIRPVLK